MRPVIHKLSNDIWCGLIHGTERNQGLNYGTERNDEVDKVIITLIKASCGIDQSSKNLINSTQSILSMMWRIPGRIKVIFVSQSRECTEGWRAFTKFSRDDNLILIRVQQTLCMQQTFYSNLHDQSIRPSHLCHY